MTEQKAKKEQSFIFKKSPFKKRKVLVQSLYKILTVPSTQEETRKLISEVMRFKEDVSEDKILSYVEELYPVLSAVLEKQSEYQVFVEQSLQKNWSLDRISKVVLAILYVAMYELALSKKESYGLIITGYLELTESFNHEQEIRFVNAVLDKMIKMQTTDSA